MSRNLENTNGIVKENHSDLQRVKSALAELTSTVDVIAYHVQKNNFREAMGGPDISEFFPVENAKQLDDFMDRTHPEWTGRRDEFYNYLYTCITDSKSSFTKGLFKALFTRSYMNTVKWPSFGFVVLNILNLQEVVCNSTNLKNLIPFRAKKSTTPTVPKNFVAFLRSALSKMAGNKFIKPELVDMEFWNKLGIKFAAVRFYDKSLVNNVF